MAYVTIPKDLSKVPVSYTHLRALQESAALFSFLQANGIQSMQQLHEKIADMNSRYYDLRGKIVKAERRIAILTERGEMWEQYNQYKSIHKQLAKVKPEKREQFEQRHSRELILYDAAARYLKELKDSGEGTVSYTHLVISAVKSFYFLEEHDALGGLEKVGTMLDKARYSNSLSSKLTAHLQRINRTDLIPYIQYDTKHGKGGI